MARRHVEPEDEMIRGINVTPLVDVVLVLLIVFMVTATFIVQEAIEVELPRAASGGESIATTLNLVIDQEGTLFLDGNRSSLDDARRAVREALAKDQDSRAVISADRRVPHGQVVELIDLVKTEGLSKFAINIEKDSTAPSSAATPSAGQSP